MSIVINGHSTSAQDSITSVGTSSATSDPWAFGSVLQSEQAASAAASETVSASSTIAGDGTDAAAGSTNSLFQQLTSELQAFLIQMQGGAAIDPTATANAAANAASTAATTSAAAAATSTQASVDAATGPSAADDANATAALGESQPHHHHHHGAVQEAGANGSGDIQNLLNTGTDAAGSDTSSSIAASATGTAAVGNSLFESSVLAGGTDALSPQGLMAAFQAYAATTGQTLPANQIGVA